jgi:16S rRNA (uracil1498-N3)-methyltransferase
VVAPIAEGQVWSVQARRAAAHVFVDDLAEPRLGSEDLHHLERVLRLRAGEAVSTADGRGGWRPCRLGAGGDLEPTGEMVTPSRPVPDLTVGFAVTKADRPEWAERHLDRLREVARQAAMQSRRLRVPVIEAVVPVEALLVPDALWSASLALAAPGGRPPSLRRPMILVGPEGGWTPEEEAAAPAQVDLGPFVLRTETAALVAGSLLAALRHSLLSEPHLLR